MNPDSQKPPPRYVLGDSPELFRLLVERVKDYAIFMLTPEGNVATWNAGAQHIKGYAPEEIIGRHFSTFYEPDAVARHWPDHELRMAREVGRFEDEGWRVRKDGSRFWANVVLTALYDAKGELRGFAKVTRDLTTRRQVEDLQRSERRTNEFLAMLAHELRNPLSPLQTAVDILERKPDDAATVAWVRQVLDRQVRHLTRLVDDLLDVSRVTTDKISLRFESLDLAAVLRETIESMRPQVESRHHELIVRIPSTPSIVRGDPTRLAQIFTNLLNNAIKYTPDGGRIEVSLTEDSGFANVDVSDNGVGIAPELMPRMFDLFVQGNRGLDRSEGGLGIGLTLVKRLVELHGGTISASSAGPGHGSRFSIRLPVLSAQLNSIDTPADAAVGAVPLKVLIIDDNEDSASSIAMLLRMLGNETETATDGVNGIARASETHPDLILLDIGLPQMSGYDVARALRTLPGLARTVLVACTGYAQDEDRRKGREAGFDHHLTKPVQASDLEAILARTAARKHRAP